MKQYIAVCLILAGTVFAGGCTRGGVVDTWGDIPNSDNIGTFGSKSMISFSFVKPAVSATIDEFAHTVSITVPYGTDLSSLVAVFRTTGARVIVADAVQTSGLSANNFLAPVQYSIMAIDGTVSVYTISVSVASVTAKEISKFSINSVDAVISGTSVTIALPYGTDVSALIAVFSSTGTVTVGGVVQESGTTVNNFTSSVLYTVWAADNSSLVYTITVSVAGLSSKEITSFTIYGVNGIISGTSITLVMPYGTNISAVAPVFITSGVSVSVLGVTQQSGVTFNNFTTALPYLVTAGDGSTATYTVSVSVMAASTVNTLSSLAISTGTLSPVFSPDTLSYTLSIFFNAGSVALTPVLADTKSSMQINGSTAGSGTPDSIVISADGQTITIVVTSESGSQNTYTLKIAYQMAVVNSGSGFLATTTYTTIAGSSFVLTQVTPDAVNQSFPIGTDAHDEDGNESPAGKGSGLLTDYRASATITSPFMIGKTEVTEDLWQQVLNWTLANQSITQSSQPVCDASAGGTTEHRKVGSMIPVRSMTWRSAAVWCNMLTLYYNTKNGANLTPVYQSPSKTFANYWQDDITQVLTNNGFRLPTREEWEYSARYCGSTPLWKNDLISLGGLYWQPGAWASGAAASGETSAGLVAVLTGDIAAGSTKAANFLGLYDMSGNAREYCTNGSSSGLYYMMSGNCDVSEGYWVSYRNEIGWGEQSVNSGFRIARTK